MRTKSKKGFVIDEYQEKVLGYVEDGENLFVTGKAGTGKTALLREIKRRFEGKKVVAVLAPTGVAALNAGGFTMHSFLRIPLGPYLPGYKRELDKLFSVKKSDETLRNLDVMIIDEVSMVRCDTLDATDAILRHYRHTDEPFGGIQLIMFGDLYQLAPVADTKQKEILKESYKANNFYFFLSKALQKIKYRVVELQKIHRQDNRNFIKLLNAVRVGELTMEFLQMLDKRVDKNIKHTPKDDIITLTTHNYQSKKLNMKMYNMLGTPEYLYKAKIVKITDDWHDRRPVNYNLYLKVGSRVMFLRKDSEHGENPWYVNGTMGWVVSLSENGILVITDEGYPVDVKRAVWQQFDYIIDKKKKTIKTEVTAEYHQYPLRLAWAVSIHKSQGLTLAEVNIDASKAFAFGQVYVALSRCKTLEGIHLLQKIPSHKIMADDVVKQYFDSIDGNGYVSLPKELQEEEYEDKPLVLNIKSSSFDKILIGEKKKHWGLIRTADDGKTFFVQNGDGTFRPKKFWAGKIKLTDHCNMNGGDFPYIFRRYRKAILVDKSYGLQVEVEIDGEIQPREGCKDAYGNPRWGYIFRFVRKKMSMEDVIAKLRNAAKHAKLNSSNVIK